jgi:hypothetical protein
MKSDNPTSRDVNQGEGDRRAARHYDSNVREFIAGGKVEPAARDAEAFVAQHPEEAARAERKARRGPGTTRVSLDELVAKGRTLVERVRPIVDRAIGKLRAGLRK